MEQNDYTTLCTPCVPPSFSLGNKRFHTPLSLLQTTEDALLIGNFKFIRPVRITNPILKDLFFHFQQKASMCCKCLDLCWNFFFVCVARFFYMLQKCSLACVGNISWCPRNVSWCVGNISWCPRNVSWCVGNLFDLKVVLACARWQAGG